MGIDMRLELEQIARQAGAMALEYFQKNIKLELEEKQHLDLVTQADKAVEAYLQHKLAELFPEDGFYGEESADLQAIPESKRIWVIDPIDGTFNFVRGSQDWAISIGLYEKVAGISKATFGVIFAPAADILISGGQNHDVELNGKLVEPANTFSKAKGCIGVGFHPTFRSETVLDTIYHLLEQQKLTFRHAGSACISMLAVALDRTDGYLGMGDSSWDVMGALAILEKLGYQSTIDWASFTLEQKQVFSVGKPQLVCAIANQAPVFQK